MVRLENSYFDMKILMLVNWKVTREEEVADKIVQESDIVRTGKPYWFFRYFAQQYDVDVLDISSLPWIENFEKNKLHFYCIQGIRAIPKLRNYDLIISHGMQSAVIVCLWRKFFPGKTKHLLFEIGGFNSAAESGKTLHLLQYASRSLDAVIYHTSQQLDYYRNFYPWIVPKARFIRFGTDYDFFSQPVDNQMMLKQKYILCLGYAKRDWETLIEAYRMSKVETKLWLVGHVDHRYTMIHGVRQFPFVSTQKMKQLIQEAQYCVLPLKYYNYSFGQMTLLQQMAMGKLVITSDVPSMRDYVCDGETAVFYQPEDVEDLKNKLLWASSHEDERIRIENNARKFIKEECNERIMAKEIEKFIETIIS